MYGKHGLELKVFFMRDRMNVCVTACVCFLLAIILSRNNCKAYIHYVTTSKTLSWVGLQCLNKTAIST